jgi:hypothetical protein
VGTSVAAPRLAHADPSKTSIEQGWELGEIQHPRVMAMGGAVPPDGHFLGWTPGKTARRAPKGEAWRLRPGDDLVLQLHLVPTGKEERVQPEIGLWFTDEPTTRSFAVIALFSEAIDVAPGVADFTLRDEVTLPAPTTLHAIYPHAHRVCRRMRATVQRPGEATAATLFAIDRWDFDWLGLDADEQRRRFARYAAAFELD